MVGKILKRSLQDQIDSNLEYNRPMTDSQYDFAHGNSWLTNLVTFIEEMTKVITAG